jgi:site-specific DNA recombinase
MHRQEGLCSDQRKRKVLQVDLFSDNDTSALTRSTKVRLQYADIIHRARQSDFGTILAHSNCRLTRRPREYEHSSTHTIRTTSSSALSRPEILIRTSLLVVRSHGPWQRGMRPRRNSHQNDSRLRGSSALRQANGTMALARSDTDRNTVLIPNPAEVALIDEVARRVLDGDPLSVVVADWNRSGKPHALMSTGVIPTSASS